MNRRYYSDPPSIPEDIPEFVYKRYKTSEYISEMIQWAIKEYDKALRHLTRHASSKTIQFFHKEYSPMRVLAEWDGFKDLIQNINNQNYNQLSLRERVFLRRAYELFKALS